MKVICLGSHHLGGGNKSPVLMAMAHFFQNELKQNSYKLQCAILNFDVYHLLKKDQILIPVDIQKSFELSSDEGLWMAQNQKWPVFLARDYFRALQKLKELGFDLVLCEGGVYHPQIKQSQNLKMFFCDSPSKNNLWNWLTHLYRRNPYFFKEVQSLIEGIDFTKNIEIRSLDGKDAKNLEGQGIGVCTSIARPNRFKKTLQDFGLFIVKQKYLSDHSRKFLSVFNTLLQKYPQLIWLMTEKDAIKLESLDYRGANIYIVRQNICLSPFLQEQLLQWIQE